MKKFFNLVLPIIFCFIFLSSCGSIEKSINETENTNKRFGNSVFITISNEYFGDVVCDTRTGVQYWRSESGYNPGTLSLLVDADGKPLIYKGE